MKATIRLSLSLLSHHGIQTWIAPITAIRNKWRIRPLGYGTRLFLKWILWHIILMQHFTCTINQKNFRQICCAFWPAFGCCSLQKWTKYHIPMFFTLLKDFLMQKKLRQKSTCLHFLVFFNFFVNCASWQKVLIPNKTILSKIFVSENIFSGFPGGLMEAEHAKRTTTTNFLQKWLNFKKIDTEGTCGRLGWMMIHYSSYSFGYIMTKII